MKRLLGFLTLVFCLGFFNAEAFASCGTAYCPLNTHKHLNTGGLEVSVSREYINQNQIFVGSEKSFIGAISEHHDEIQTINERTTVKFQYGLSNALGVNLELPFVHREHSHIHNHMGVPIHESWNFSGFGDMVVTGQFGFNLGQSEKAAALSFLAGAKLASGVTDATNAEGDRAEITVQPGSGSTDLLFGFNFRKPLFTVGSAAGDVHSFLPVILGFTYQLNGEGKEDFRFGDVVQAHLGTEYQILPRATLLFQGNLRYQQFADVGTTREPKENSGGTWIYASPGLGVQFSDAFSGFTYVQLPVYRNVHGIQQVSKMNLLFGLSANVNLLK